jgi:hypothetical protein
MELSSIEPNKKPGTRVLLGKRHVNVKATKLVLIELEPGSVVDPIELGDEHSGKIVTSGKMRETCPKCKDVHLQLVLLQKNIKMAHLLCTKCAACFDVRYTNGASALAL